MHRFGDELSESINIDDLKNDFEPLKYEVLVIFTLDSRMLRAS